MNITLICSEIAYRNLKIAHAYVLSLLRICGNNVCESSHHLDSLLSNVIHYFRISDIFQGLVVIITPWQCRHRLQKPVRHSVQGVEQERTLWISKREYWFSLSRAIWLLSGMQLGSNILFLLITKYATEEC